VTRYRESAENTASHTHRWCCAKVCSNSQVAVLHSLIDLSADVVAIVPMSGDIAIFNRYSSCAWNS
jgi:hypothetical protein